MNETESILAEAREYLPNCDWLGDLYEGRTIWVSDRVIRESNFTGQEITSKFSINFIKSNKSLAQLKHEMIQQVMGGEGTQNYTFKFSNREVSVDYKYKVFVFDGNRYIAAEALRIDGETLT